MGKQLALIALALLLVFGGSYLIVNYEVVLNYWDELYREPDSREVVGQVTRVSGNPKFKLPKKLVYKNLREKQQLRYFDTLQTDESSKATIAFNNGLVLELETNSILVLERTEDGSDDGIVISFLQGNFKVLQEGRSGKVFVSKDSQILDSAGRLPPKEPIVITPELSIIEPDLEPEIPTPSPTPPPVKITRPSATPKPTPTRPKESLPDDYIASVFNKQKPFLFRCYAQHLRLNPNASGKMNVSFTIESAGKVSNVRILRSTIADPRLQKCTLTVLERMQFRSFDGDPLVVNYPINFE